jgi:hypothetical protein
LGHLFKGIGEYRVHTLLSLLSLQTSLKTDKSYAATLSVIINLTKRRKNGLDYYGEVATSTEDITIFKILINSTLSTKDAEMMMIDINNYYLGTHVPRYE